MAKPGKDGMEKTLEECMETFTMVLKNKDITKNTFLRNDGFLAVQVQVQVQVFLCTSSGGTNPNRTSCSRCVKKPS